MTRHFQVLLEWDRDEGVWVTTVPALDRLSTSGEARNEAIENTEEAILGYLEAAAMEGLSVSPDQAGAEIVDVEVTIV